MSKDWIPSEPGMEERWQRALKNAGVHVVRARLIQSPGGSAALVSGIGMEPITKGYVERGYVIRKPRSNKKRQDVTGKC